MRTIRPARLLPALVALLVGCGEPAATAPARAPLRSDGSGRGEAEAMTTIEIDAGTGRWTARIADTPAGRDFLAQLPLDLVLTDYAATEKVATLPRPLRRDGAPDATTPRAGDIGYYAPWGNIAIYHKDGPHSPGLIVLGRLDGPATGLAAAIAVRVTIRRLQGARATR